MNCPRCGSKNVTATTAGYWQCLTCKASGIITSGNGLSCRLIGLVAVLCCSVARSETPDDIIARLDAINRRLEAMPGFVPAPTPQVWTKPTTYAEARQQAIVRNLPLVIWSGESLCPGCVKSTSADGTFVNWVGVIPGFAGMSSTLNAIVVGLPENGELYHIATITQWEVLGHIKSTQEAIQAFRLNRQVIRQDRAMRAYQGRVEMPVFRSSGGC